MTTPKKILVTCAPGFIGSHTCVELLQAGFGAVALDNWPNSSRKSLVKGEQIKSCPHHKRSEHALTRECRPLKLSMNQH